MTLALDLMQGRVLCLQLRAPFAFARQPGPYCFLLSISFIPGFSWLCAPLPRY